MSKFNTIFYDRAVDEINETESILLSITNHNHGNGTC